MSPSRRRKQEERRKRIEAMRLYAGLEAMEQTECFGDEVTEADEVAELLTNTRSEFDDEPEQQPEEA